MTVQAALERMDARSWEEFRSELRWLERHSPAPLVEAEDERIAKLEEMIGEDDPGHPLGVGMPTGETLREDGESHRQAWMRITRMDICAYCGERLFTFPCSGFPSGSCDHIEPQTPTVKARGLGGAHSWLNYTGACQRCNGSKGDDPLLAFLYMRRWNRRVVPKRG